MDKEVYTKDEVLKMLEDLQQEINAIFHDRPEGYSHPQRTEFYLRMDTLFLRQINKLKMPDSCYECPHVKLDEDERSRDLSSDGKGFRYCSLTGEYVINRKEYHDYGIDCPLLKPNNKLTNQDKFIEVFGLDVWQHMIVFSGLAEQFKEYWTSQYKEQEIWE